MVAHLTVEQRQLALRLKARGLSLRQIGPQVGCSHELVRIIARRGPSRPQRRIAPWLPGPGRLTLADREEVSLGLHAGEAFWVIAARLGKATSTVSREVAGNGGRSGGRRWRPSTTPGAPHCYGQHLRAVKMASTASGRPLSGAGSGPGRGRGDWGKSYEPGDVGSAMAPQDKGHRERRTNGGGGPGASYRV